MSLRWLEMAGAEGLMSRYPTSGPELLSTYKLFARIIPKTCEHRDNDAAQVPSPRDDVVLFWRHNAAVPIFNVWRKLDHEL
jgi:hypothetical protein